MKKILLMLVFITASSQGAKASFKVCATDGLMIKLNSEQIKNASLQSMVPLQRKLLGHTALVNCKVTRKELSSSWISSTLSCDQGTYRIEIPSQGNTFWPADHVVAYAVCLPQLDQESLGCNADERLNCDLDL